LPGVHVTLTALKSREEDDAATTLGEHLRHIRLRRKLSQKEAALILGVDADSVLNWEKGRTTPPVTLMPAILRFLGYDPFPEPVTVSERMLAKRRAMGWTIKEAAERLGVDESTWGQWERTGCIRWERYRMLLETFLGR